MSRGAWPIWGGFVRAALALAITAGFGLGADLFLLQALHTPIGTVWPVAAQAHGHVQIFGWAGLMVLGVGLHCLPRLRGTRLPHPGRARATLVLLVGGCCCACWPRRYSPPWRRRRAWRRYSRPCAWACSARGCWRSRVPASLSWN